MVHVAAYFDETYFDDDSVFMGGYVASVEAWSALIPRWKDILDEHPRVPYCHNSRFKSEKWCHDQGVADTHLLPAKLIKLASLIAASGLSFPALSIMEKSLFDEIIKARIKAEKNPQYELLRNVYYFSYTRLLALLFNRIQELNDIVPQEHKMSPLDVFVDKNGKLSKKATDLFFTLKKLADPTRHPLFGVADHCDDKT